MFDHLQSKLDIDQTWIGHFWREQRLFTKHNWSFRKPFHLKKHINGKYPSPLATRSILDLGKHKNVDKRENWNILLWPHFAKGWNAYQKKILLEYRLTPVVPVSRIFSPHLPKLSVFSGPRWTYLIAEQMLWPRSRLQLGRAGMLTLNSSRWQTVLGCAFPWSWRWFRPLHCVDPALRTLQPAEETMKQMLSHTVSFYPHNGALAGVPDALHSLQPKSLQVASFHCKVMCRCGILLQIICSFGGI